MASGRVVQKHTDGRSSVPRQGSIYARLDRAREERAKSISPKEPANDAHKRVTPARRPSKLSQLPTIKSQEAYDPGKGLHPAVKLAIGALAFAAMAGFTLMDWTPTQKTEVIPATADAPLPTQLPGADAPARVPDAPKVTAGSSDDLPAIPAAPSDAPFVQVQQETAPLIAPDGPRGTAPGPKLKSP